MIILFTAYDVFSLSYTLTVMSVLHSSDVPIPKFLPIPIPILEINGVPIPIPILEINGVPIPIPILEF